MYTVSKGPSKIVAKTRRGITQNLERLETLRDSSRKTVDTEEVEIISVQKPIFHMNGQKKSSISRSQQEAISPQHEEIIKFIYDSWNSVCKECDDEENKSSTNGNSHPSIVYYEESEPNNHLKVWITTTISTSQLPKECCSSSALSMNNIVRNASATQKIFHTV